jgi:3-oxoacyl-[acyl-carrier-protein] synthase II
MAKPRVFITGAGVASPIGCGLAEFYSGLESGEKGTRAITCFDAAFFPSAIGGEVKRGGEVLRLPPEQDRKAVFAGMALEELFSGSDGHYSEYAPPDRLMFAGAGIDHFDLKNYIDSGDSARVEWGPHCSHPSAVAAALARRYGIEGGASVNVAACVASTQSIGTAFRALRRVPGRLAVAGGFDSMLGHLHYMGFYKLGALSESPEAPQRACRPFSKNRSGLVIGEGAAFFSLETVPPPGRVPLAEIAGYASTMDAHTVTDPAPEGRALAAAALAAITEAGLKPDDIDCAHLHETGTYKNALAEASAMRLIFGERYTEVPVFSLKGQTGHLIGACGALETLAVIDSLKNQRVLPTVNYEVPDPDVPLNVVRGGPLKLKVRNVLKLSAAFGGQNAALVFKIYEA